MCKQMILNAIAIGLSVSAVVMTFVGIPAGLSLEPILGIAVFCLALGNLDKCDCKPKATRAPARRKRR